MSMFFEDAPEHSEYTVNLNSVIQTEKYILASDVAQLVKINGMINVGNILKSLEDEKLSAFVELIEETYHLEEPDENSCHEELMILSLILLQAEGGQIDFDADKAAKYMSHTLSFIMMESLYRKGLIELIHDNLTFDEAAANRPVAKATATGLKLNEEYGDE